MVCSVVGKTLLHETIFALCLDPRRSLDSRYSELPNYPQYFPRANLVGLNPFIVYKILS